MKRIFLLATIIHCMVSSIQAQVISWSVKPGLYDKIEPYWNDMYLVEKKGKYGIINGDGSEIVPIEASQITGFYGGLSLILKSEGGKMRILGILSSDGSYAAIDGSYYTIPYQEFFSEGLLTVTTARGQTAYMNAMGSVVKTFNVPMVTPFSEGYATIGEGRDYALIDKNFSKLTIRLGDTVSGVYGGTGVYKGQAIIWAGNGKFYSFDVNSGLSKKISKPSSMDIDYLGGLSSITGRPGEVEYDEPKRPAVTIASVSQNGLYGYKNDGTTILPCQFKEAENFHGHYALAKKDNQYGLLTYMDGSGTFSAKADAKISYRKSAGHNLLHRFGVSIPDQLSNTAITVHVKDENGIPVSITNNSGGYEFKANGGTGYRAYHVEVEADGLKMWQGEIAYNYIVEPDPVEPSPDQDRKVGILKPLTVSVKATNTQADRNYRCYVKATITNPNPEPITTTVTMTGSNLLEAVSQRMTIPANGSKDISTYFTVRKATSGQKVTVTTTAGGSATLDGLQLIPN